MTSLAWGPVAKSAPSCLSWKKDKAASTFATGTCCRSAAQLRPGFYYFSPEYRHLEHASLFV
jgi:hypothetical protein